MPVFYPNQGGASGYSGAPGYSGYSGQAGYSGYSGQAGYVGSDGDSGYSGPSGQSGFSGYSGTGASGFSGYSGTTNITIGVPTIDPDYTTGLFVWTANSTLMANALLQVDQVLAALAPAQASYLLTWSTTTSGGVTGNLTFSTSYPIANETAVIGIGTLPAEGTDSTFAIGQTNNSNNMRLGIFPSTTTSWTGVINNGLAADIGVYPASAINSGGTANMLYMYINGNATPAASYNLVTGVTTNSANNSGFTMSAITNYFNGMFAYRTGSWIVYKADLNTGGWNYIQIMQVVSGTDYPAVNLYCDWVIDIATTGAYPSTASSESLYGSTAGDGLLTTHTFTLPSGRSTTYLSGINYYTGGTATYTVTWSNLYRNTWSSSAAAMAYTVTNVSAIASTAIPASGGNPAATYTVPPKTATISATRLNPTAGSSITVKTTALRTVQATGGPTTGGTVTNILLDNAAASSTATYDGFDDENYRLPSSPTSVFDLTSQSTGQWNTTTLISGATTGYSDGLQVYNSTLVYPTLNFNLTNAPGGNPSYASCTGIRYYYRYFNVGSGWGTFNLKVNVGSAAIDTFANIQGGSQNGTNHVAIGIKLPGYPGNGTQWMDVSQSFIHDTWTTGAGCFDGTPPFTFGSSSTNVTVGTKNTGNTSGYVYLMVIAPQGWTGSITDITLIGQA